MRQSKELTLAEELYGSPKGLTGDRRRAFFKVDKSPSEVKKELQEHDKNVNTNYYILAYNNQTLVSCET